MLVYIAHPIDLVGGEATTVKSMVNDAIWCLEKVGGCSVFLPSGAWVQADIGDSRNVVYINRTVVDLADLCVFVLPLRVRTFGTIAEMAWRNGRAGIVYSDDIAVDGSMFVRSTGHAIVSTRIGLLESIAGVHTRWLER